MKNSIYVLFSKAFCHNLANQLLCLTAGRYDTLVSSFRTLFLYSFVSSLCFSPCTSHGRLSVSLPSAEETQESGDGENRQANGLMWILGSVCEYTRTYADISISFLSYLRTTFGPNNQI